MIETIYGPMDEKLIEKGKKSGRYENENEICEWVEYWIEGVQVHRSSTVKLKKGLFAELFGCNFIPPPMNTPEGKEYRRAELRSMGVDPDD